ncbi:PfkB family carbohydrate kinase, partial [Streptomyces sp. GC420]|uniref:PfkB family carbohydrate kinase n=1 Tax=Streptomyces sp. GC420 TaxID=2697568 RepID=UPI001D1D0C28
PRPRILPRGRRTPAQGGPQGRGGHRGHHGAGGDVVVFEPAPRVDVVSHVGAGDAFAAGFLSATLRGLRPAERLRHGHLTAAAALTARGDLGVPLPRAEADRLVALDAAGWGTLRLGPGGTAAGQAESVRVEVRTP